MTEEEIKSVWEFAEVSEKLNSAFSNNSETELLSVLKNHSFLFYELFNRKQGIQPIFHEVSFGNELRCDFAWLNDNSDGPEWTLVEIEKPKIRLFSKNAEPSCYLNHAIEQVKFWRRYFEETPSEKSRIFGAVARFRYIIVAGDIEDWSTENAKKWRIDHNKESDFEIRSSNIFIRALEQLKSHPEELWSFAENPKTLPSSKLKAYWKSYGYMDAWRKIIY